MLNETDLMLLQRLHSGFAYYYGKREFESANKLDQEIGLLKHFPMFGSNSQYGLILPERLTL